MDKQYKINEIFYSLQGEGVRAGTPALFLRFSSCNLRCSLDSHGFNCDTEFDSGEKMSASNILAEFNKLAPDCRWAICTGGEPLLQLDSALCQELKAAGFSIAVETNGTVNPERAVLDALDWITCSPKVPEEELKLERCNELKYVRAYGQGLPEPTLDAPNKLISPAFSGDACRPETLDWCIELCLKNPPWRLSVQQHKIWSIK